MRLTIPSLAAILCTMTPAFADEIRIVDPRGLSRAVRVVKREAVVTISNVKPGAACVMANADTVVAEKSTVASGEGVCIFQGVPAGTWRLAITPDGAFKVRIND